MNNLKTATQKHMTLDDRISIEKGLDQHLSPSSRKKYPTARSDWSGNGPHKHLRFHKSSRLPARSEAPRKSKSTGLSRNTIVLMNLLTNVLWQKIAKRKIFVVPMPLFAKGCADPAIIATLTARTLFLDLTIAVCWIKLLLSAMVAVKRIPAASIKPTTAHPLHTGNIKPSLWNQEQVLTFRLLTLLLWMNW